MEHGDFYASTGVVLEEIAFRDGTLRLQIAPKDGVTYRTQFIGTVAGYDRESRPGTTQPDKRMTRIYSADIGRVLDEQTGTNPAYRLSGREIYVRAKVIASTKHPNPITIGEYEVAWTQPVMPRP
jgi:hypothetical protein